MLSPSQVRIIFHFLGDCRKRLLDNHRFKADTIVRTVFDSTREWRMMDSSDPLDGWSLKTLLATKASPAKKDAYGQLYYYLKRVFTKLHSRLRSNAVSLELHHVDAQTLDMTFAGQHFDRIEVSNICDVHYLGIEIHVREYSRVSRVLAV